MARKAVKRGAPLAGQGDLFAPRPHVNSTLRENPKHYAGPVSQVTGGPLNAIEAGRVMTRQSIAFGGFLFQDGRVTCNRHGWEGGSWPPGKDAGYRMTVFTGTSKDSDLGACAHCGERVVGERPS